jgi:hypothetical protein
MAFETGNLFNVAGAPPGFGMYIYKSDSDDRATVTTSGYFDNEDDNINLGADDIIHVTGNAGGYQLRVDTVSGGTITMELAGSPAYLAIHHPDAAVTTSTWAVSPFDGTVTKMWTVLHSVITQADTTFGIELGGTNATSDDKTVGNADIITIESSGDAAGDVDVGNVDGANAVTADQAIEITCGGEGSVTAIVTVMLEIMPN